MQTLVPLACFLSVIRPPGIQYEDAILQIAPVDKSKCPFIKDGNDIGFQLFTRHNPTAYQELKIGDDERLFASNMDFHAPTVIYFHAFMEQPSDGSGIMIREAFMQNRDTNVIMVDAHQLEAGPWYFTAAQNTWYIGRFAAQFIDYMVSRGLNLNNTHLIGHSLGAQAAGVAGSAIQSGRVSRITGLDPALPLFTGLPPEQRLDSSDALFVDVIHTDAGIFGVKEPVGHVDFYPNGGHSPQPGCELEVVIPKKLLLNKFFCSHWRSYMFYTESVLRPAAFVAVACPSWRDFARGRCAGGPTAHMGFGVDEKENYEHMINPDITEPKWTELDASEGDIQIYINKNNKYLSLTQKHRDSSNKTQNLKQKGNKKYHHHYDLLNRQKRIQRDTREQEKKGNNHLHHIHEHTDSKNNKVNINKEKNTNNNITKKNAVNVKDVINSNNELNVATNQKSIAETNENSRITLHSNLMNSRSKKSTISLSNEPKHRQKRFLSLFKADNSNGKENFLFKALQFLLSKGKYVVPVISVVREINTLVKSTNGELNQVTKESNKYIGANPPELKPISYTLELGTDQGLVAFVKKLFGVGQKGDKLTIGSR